MYFQKAVCSPNKKLLFFLPSFLTKFSFPSGFKRVVRCSFAGRERFGNEAISDLAFQYLSTMDPGGSASQFGNVLQSFLLLYHTEGSVELDEFPIYASVLPNNHAL